LYWVVVVSVQGRVVVVSVQRRVVVVSVQRRVVVVEVGVLSANIYLWRERGGAICFLLK
jgi:hypothetical protein